MQAQDAFKAFLADLQQFEQGIKRVFAEWSYSCEHNLTNDKMNRIAWIGQSAVCACLGVPAAFRSGYGLLTEQERAGADALALRYLNIWLTNKGLPPTDGERNHKSSDMY
jgi:hypothetical protein